MKIIVSAPGKIHLMGEHAVVYGKPALLAAINKRLYVEITEAKELEIETDDEKKLIEKAVEIVLARLKMSHISAHIKVTSSIPSGRHAGSSAAVSVAAVGALLYFCKKIWNPNLINELAYEVEKFQHGTPSGGDNTVCTFGGFIWFRKELEFLKTIWQLPFKPSEKLAPFVLVDTGRPKENTGEMVGMVREFMDNYKDHGRMLLDQNEQATKDVTVAIKTGDEMLLIDAMRRGEKTLEGLGVVSDKVLQLIQKVEEAHGTAKILGGGGKKEAAGLVLVYLRDLTVLKQLIKKYNYPLSSVQLGEEGVRLESGKTKDQMNNGAKEQ